MNPCNILKSSESGTETWRFGMNVIVLDPKGQIWPAQARDTWRSRMKAATTMPQNTPPIVRRRIRAIESYLLVVVTVPSRDKLGVLARTICSPSGVSSGIEIVVVKAPLTSVVTPESTAHVVPTFIHTL